MSEEENVTPGKETLPEKVPQDKIPTQPVPPIPQQILEKLPEADRKEVERIFSMVMSHSGPFVNPLFEKVTPEHIGRALENSEKKDKRDSLYKFGYFAITLLFVGGLIWYLVSNQKDQFLSQIIAAFLGFGAGFGIGKAVR